MGQKSSSPASSLNNNDKSRKARKSTFYKQKSTPKENDGDFELRLFHVHRKSFPFLSTEAAFRDGIPCLVKPQNLSHLHPGVKEIDPFVLASSSTPPLPLNNNPEEQALPHYQIINWERLSEESVLVANTENVWNGPSGIFDIEQNEAALEFLAQRFARTVKTAVSSSSQKLQSESVLDPRRCMKLNFAMKRMELDIKKIPKLIWALRDLNEAFLTQEAVEIMLSALMWPTSQEAEDIKQKIRLDGGEEHLAQEDLLLWFIFKSVPDCGAKVRALNFRYEFDSQVDILMQCLIMLKSASAEVCQSQLLKRLMRVILLIGNAINTTNREHGAASGIHISSLLRLHEMKTKQGAELSFLDCVVSYLDVCAPEVFEVSDDLFMLEKAAVDIPSLAFIQKSLANWRKRLVDQVKPIKLLDSFYQRALLKLAVADDDFLQCRTAFEQALQHFCLPSKSLDNIEFFGTLFEFLEDFNQAVSKLQAAQKALQKRFLMTAPPVVKSGLQNPNFMSQRRQSVAQHANYKQAHPPSVFGKSVIKGVLPDVQEGRPLSLRATLSAAMSSVVSPQQHHNSVPVKVRNQTNRPVSIMRQEQNLNPTPEGLIDDDEEDVDEF